MAIITRLGLSLSLLLSLTSCSSSILLGGGAAASPSGVTPDASSTPLTPDGSGSVISGSHDSMPLLNPRTDVPIDSVVLGGETLKLYAHPRIWLTSDALADLKAKTLISNSMWTGLKTSVDAGIAAASFQTAADGGTLINYSVAYMATGSAAYLNAAKTILLNYTNPALYNIACDGSVYCGNDNIDYGSMDLMYIAAAYDWLHDALTPTERLKISDWVFTKFIPFLRLHPYYGDPLHNLGQTKWCGEFLYSLATVDDDARSLPLLQSSYTFWTQRILPILDTALPGGHTYSGSGYGYNRVFKYQLYAFEAAWSALGLDMYSRHPWPADEVFYRIHSTLPVDGLFFSDWESADGIFNQGRMTENEAILAGRYRGSRAGKLAQYYIENDFRPRALYNQGGTRVHPLYVGLWFLWYDPRLEQEDYKVAEPTAYVADGMGLFMSREDWHDSSSTWASLSASKYVGDHQLHNEGSFKIFKHEHLVIENGRFYSGQASNLTPTDTNILFIGNGSVDYGNVTGGLYRRDTGSLANLARFEANDAERFAYAKADLTTAYMPAYFPLNFFHRSMVHLKSANGSALDYVVLFDRVSSKSAQAKKTFTHLVQTPSLNGNVATMDSTNHLARLTVTNLMPETSAFSIESVTDKATGGYSQEYSDAPSRLVLTKTTAAAQEDQFLSVFTVTDNMTVATPDVNRVDTPDGLWIGALVLDSMKNRVAIFSKSSPSATGSIQYSVQKTAVTQHAIFDLAAAAGFDVSITPSGLSRVITVTPNPVGTFKSDAQGVLVFTDN